MTGIGEGIPKVGMLKCGRPSCLWIARCYHCKRKSPAPTARILKRFGDHIPLHIAMNKDRIGWNADTRKRPGYADPLKAKVICVVSVLSEWGMAGVETLRERVAVLVVVDVLSFSTAVNVAVSQGAVIYPFPYGDLEAAKVAADQVGALLAKPRRAGGEQLSLSPASLRAIPHGTKLMLPSPNGSRLSLADAGKPVLADCLRNAAAIARVAREMSGGGAIGVIPAGERWPDGSLRPGVEDLLGAGAIVHHLNMPCSPEAQVARDAFRSAQDGLASMVRASVSGQELAGWGYGGDVDVALELEVSDCAPLLSEGAYRAI